MSIDVGHYSEADNFPPEVQGTMLPQDLCYKGMDFELNEPVVGVISRIGNAVSKFVRTNAVAGQTPTRGLL